MGRGRCPREQATALGRAQSLGHLRAGAVQLPVHDGSDEGNRSQIQGRWHLLQSLARLGDVLLPVMSDAIQKVLRNGIAAHTKPAGCRVPQLAPMEQRAIVRALALVGWRDS